jgi:hypothetical protein
MQMQQQPSPLFADFCSLLQTLSNQRGTEEKKKKLRRFVHTWRVKYGDFLSAMRLLLPQVLSYTKKVNAVDKAK